MDAYLGQITLFAGNYAPENWAICDGRALSVNDNQALFSLIGTTYGGDGVNTFKLPDLRGRLPIGMGQGPGLLNNYILAQTVGVDSVTLSAANLPVHNHALMASSNTATLNAPATNSVLGKASATFYLPSTASPITDATQAATAISNNTTAGAAHDNSMPTMALNYIICLAGVYPTGN